MVPPYCWNTQYLFIFKNESFQVEFLDEKVAAMSISEFSENAAEHRKNMTIPLKSIPTPEMVSCAVLGRPLNDITITV